MDGGELGAGRPVLGRSRGLLDFNRINTPTRFQPASEASQRNAVEVKSILDNLPPIGASTQEDNKPIPPRHILMSRFQQNEENNQQESITTTPRRLINLGSTSPRITPAAGTSNQFMNSNINNNENSLMNNSSGMQNSSVIVFPPLPGESESNPTRLLLNTQSPKPNNEMPKPNFQFSNNGNVNNAQDQSPEYAFEKLSQSPPSKQEPTSPKVIKVPMQSPKFLLQQPSQQSPLNHQQSPINTTQPQLSPIYQQPQAQVQPNYQQPAQLGQQTTILSTPKASYQDRLNQSLPQSTIGYSTEIIGNSPRGGNYTEILPRKTPSDYFETSINNSLDRSFSTFKRSVTREISSVFRPNSTVFDVSAFDSFLTGLINEVTNIFEVPPSILKSEVTFGRGLNSLQYLSNTSSNADNSTSLSITIDSNGTNSSNNIESILVKKLTQNFDENAKPIRKMFADAEVRKAQSREKRVDELKNLNVALNELRNAVKTISDATLQELERERYDAAARKDEEQSKFRTLERRARTLKLKRADLDSKLNHQKMEKESMERLLKQMEDSRREWEESTSDSGNSVTQKLQKEIESIRNELNNDESEKLDSLMKECTSLMASVRDGLRDEIYEMDLAEKWAVSRLRSPIRRTPMSRFDPSSSMSPNTSNMSAMQMQQPGNRSVVAQYAQEKINENRIEREAVMRDLNNPYSYYPGFEQNQY